MYPFSRSRQLVQTIVTSLTAFLCLALLQSRVASADSLQLVAVEGKHGGIMQTQIESVLKKNGYEILVVGERGQTSDVRASIVASLSKSKKKWILVVEVWNGSEGEMRSSTSFQARKPRILARILKRKLWKRIGSEIEAAESDPPPPLVAAIEESEPAQTNDAITQTTEKDVVVSKPDTSSKWPIGANITLGTQIFSRRFGYTDAPQPLALFSAPTVLALHIAGEIFPVRDFGIVAGYGFGPSSDSAVEGMSDISFPTSSRSFQVGAIARRGFGRFTPRVQLEYGGQNFTVKGGLPLPNVRYRFLRMGVGIKAVLHSRLSLGLSAGYRHLLSAGQIESSAYFPNLSGRALDASAHIDVQLLAHWYLRVIASTTKYSSSLNTEAGDMLIADEASDRYRALQLSLGYTL